MSNVIDWDRLDQLAQGIPASGTLSKETAEFAEILVKEAGGRTKEAAMELAVQVAMWREAYRAMRSEYKLPEDPESRKALGLTDMVTMQQNLQQRNRDLTDELNETTVKLGKARYALHTTAQALTEALKQTA